MAIGMKRRRPCANRHRLSRSINGRTRAECSRAPLVRSTSAYADDEAHRNHLRGVFRTALADDATCTFTNGRYTRHAICYRLTGVNEQEGGCVLCAPRAIVHAETAASEQQRSISAGGTVTTNNSARRRRRRHTHTRPTTNNEYLNTHTHQHTNHVAADVWCDVLLRDCCWLCCWPTAGYASKSAAGGRESRKVRKRSGVQLNEARLGDWIPCLWRRVTNASRWRLTWCK